MANGRKSVLLILLCLAVAMPALGDTVLYDNGGPNGTINAWKIVAPLFSVSNSFTLSAASTLNSATIYVWVNPGVYAVNLDWAITTAPFGGATLASGTENSPVTVFDFVNPYGFFIDSVQFSLPAVSLGAGTYWLQLQNATASDGTLQLAWDQNNGPSDAWASGGSIHLSGSCLAPDLPDCGSEAFYISGTLQETAVPEPSSLVLLGSGLAGAVGALWRKIAG